MVVASGVRDGGGALVAAAVSPEVLDAVFFTIVQALASTLLAFSVGLPLGWATARLVPQLRVRVESLLALPLLIPSVSAATAWTLILTRTGARFSISAVILAHAVFNAPWIAWNVSRAISREGFDGFDLARSMGASRFEAYRAGLAPAVRSALGESTLQAFSWSAMSFAIVLAIGGGPPNETLEVALFASVRYGSIERVQAIAVALWQIVLVMGIWALQQRGLRSDPALFDQPLARSGCGVRRPMFSISVFSVTALLLAPYFISPMFTSASPGAPSFWEETKSIAGALAGWALHSFLIGALAASVALVTAAALVRVVRVRDSWRWLASFPAALSPLTLGFAWWLLPGFDLSGAGDTIGALLISAILGFLFVPLAFRILEPVAARLGTGPRWVARSLGATPSQAFLWMELRAWLRPARAAFALVFGAAVGEVSVVLFFSDPEFVTLPVAAARLLGQYRFEAAQVVSAVILILGLVAYRLSDFAGIASAPEGSARA